MYTFKYVTDGPADWHLVLFPLLGCAGEEHLEWRNRIKSDSRVTHYEFDTIFNGSALTGTEEIWVFNTREDALAFRDDIEGDDPVKNYSRPYACSYADTTQPTIDCGVHRVESLINPDGTIEILSEIGPA